MSDPQNPSPESHRDQPQNPPRNPDGAVPGFPPPPAPGQPGYPAPGQPGAYGAPNPYAPPTRPGATAYPNPGPAQGQPGPYPGQPGQYPGPPAKQPVLSIISMVAGILGIVGFPVVFWIPVIGGVLGLFIPAAAVVLGFLGKSREPRAKGFWLTGIITGFVGLLLAVLDIIAWIVIISQAPFSTY